MYEMYETMLQEMARQHVRDLYEEASVERLAKVARAHKRQKAPQPQQRRRHRLREAPARG